MLDFSFTKDDDSKKASIDHSRFQNLEEKISNNTADIKPAVEFDTGSWTHNKLEFLKAENIRDLKRRKVGDPNYDPTTLYVPEDFKNKQTPVSINYY